MTNLTTSNNTATYTVTCHHVDICYPDYLTDHYNSSNQLLLAVPVHYDLTKAELIEELISEANGSDSLVWNYNLTDSQVENAIEDSLDHVTDSMLKNILSGFEDLDSEYSEVYAYYYLEVSLDCD